MTTKLETFIQPFLKKDLADIRPGDTVRIEQKIPASASALAKATTDKKATKEKIQACEGTVIARKHGKEIGATITVRKVVEGIGVEKIFPIHCPTIEKIEVLKRGKVRRAKLYYLRKAKGKKTRLKKRGSTKLTTEKTPKEEKIKEDEKKKEVKEEK